MLIKKIIHDDTNKICRYLSLLKLNGLNGRTFCVVGFRKCIENSIFINHNPNKTKQKYNVERNKLNRYNRENKKHWNLERIS